MAVSLPTDVAPAREPAVRSGGASVLRRLASNEVLIAAIAALAVMLGVTVAKGGATLFGRALWLDEYHTLFLVTKGGWLGSMRDLAQGSDYNPPALFLLTRLALAVIPGDDVVAMRLVAFASVCTALVATYLLLRRRWTPVPAAAGALALWSHGLVVDHAFEARFYGPWLAFSALFVLALARLRECPSRQRQVALALAAVALCTIHYFGVFAWGLVIAADVLSRPRRAAREHLASWPALAGPLALVACLPMYLGQKAVLGGATWIEPLSLPGAMKFLRTLFLWRPLLVVVGLAAASLLFRLALRVARRPAARPDAATPPSENGAGAGVATYGLLALAGLPLVLVAFSALVQPVTVARYGVPGLLALAPVVAYFTAAAARPLRFAIVAFLVFASTVFIEQKRYAAAGYERLMAAGAEQIRAHVAPGEPVLVMMRHDVYPIAHDRSLDGHAIRLLAPPPEEPLSGFATVERDVARVHQRLYGFPRIADLPAPGTVPRVFIMTPANRTQSSTPPAIPGYRVRSVSPALLELTPAVPAGNAAEPSNRPARGAR